MDLVQVQADEMYVKLQKRLVLWMAVAMCVPTRLWLGGVLSSSREQGLLQKLAAMVKRMGAVAGRMQDQHRLYRASERDFPRPLP